MAILTVVVLCLSIVLTFSIAAYPVCNYNSIAPQMEHSFSFLKFYMKVSSP